MARPKKQEKRVCNSHIFSLKAKDNRCRYQQVITVKFCSSYYSQSTSSAKNGSNCYEGPVFNRDRSFSTPSFVLKSEKNSYMQNASKGKPENDKKFFHFNDQKSEMFEPKPNSKNMYCSVCKQRYEDYREHVINQKHKRKINGHTFNNYILEIEAKYRQLRKQSIKGREKDIGQTNDEIDGVIIIADQENQNLQQYGMPRKIRKLDNPKPRFGYDNRGQFLNEPIVPIVKNPYYPPTPLFCQNIPNMPEINLNHIPNNIYQPYPFPFQHPFSYSPGFIQNGLFPFNIGVPPLNTGLGGIYHGLSMYNEQIQNNLFSSLSFLENNLHRQQQLMNPHQKPNYIIVQDDKQ